MKLSEITKQIVENHQIVKALDREITHATDTNKLWRLKPLKEMKKEAVKKQESLIDSLSDHKYPSYKAYRCVDQEEYDLFSGMHSKCENESYDCLGNGD